jgi:hypothetical protein
MEKACEAAAAVVTRGWDHAADEAAVFHTGR